MDFSRKIRAVKTDQLSDKYPHVLCLYKDPPAGEISLTEFEELAYERMQVLRTLEQTTQMGNKIYSAEWRGVVLGYLRKQGLRRYIRLLESTGCSAADAEPQIRREDYLSHFILRLAYCRSLDLRNWFIAREVELFKMRFLNLSTEGIKKFIKANNLEYKPITQEEKDEVKDGLCKSTYGYSHVQVETTEFYKVPFTEVTDLVRKSSVYMRKGFAYIPTTELVSCVVSWLRTHLTETLLQASKLLPQLDDERILNLINMLHASYVGKDYTNTKENSGLTAEDIHSLRKSFPICMRTLHDVLRNTSHLKHMGRLQFGLFLKGCGLSLEEAIKYWKNGFCKKIDEETFNKKYVYSIKHYFGAIGRMVNYTPYGCKKVIFLDAASGENHGCPFRQWDNEYLKQKMLEYGVSTAGVREVAEIAARGHYQIACTKYFMYMHSGTESKQVINHPNQYFEESQEILNPKSSTEAVTNSAIKLRSTGMSQNSQTSNATPKQSSVSLLDDDFDLSGIEGDF